MASRLTWNDPAGWTVTRAPAGGAGGTRRRRGVLLDDRGPADLPPAFLAQGRVTIADVVTATRRSAGRRAAAPALIDVSVDAGPDEGVLLAIRHPSGALTFHLPQERTATRRRGAGGGPAVVRFRVPVRPSAAAAGRRGLVSGAFKAIVLKVAGAVADAVLPVLALRWEQKSWKRRELVEGWLHVDQATLKAGRLAPGVPGAGEGTRSLLLLHGTFSNTAAAFAGLASADFFGRVASLYGDRIFGFDHFTLARTPEENARALLAALSDRPHVFDVITHSRGGLVLRNLVERRERFGALGRRFELGHAVLVAAPNEGTPLATPQRWQETVGWIANLLELFPENPLTFAVELVGEAIVWLARRAAGGIPGLSAMDAQGTLVAELQAPPGPQPTAYSALVSNFEPDAGVTARILDVAVDAFFATANDLVVPTEGGWRVDRDGLGHVPSERIGCFGPGGNLALAEPGAVHHLNFFTRPETVDFLVNALARKSQRLPAVDPRRPLPDRRFFRAAGAKAVAPPTASTPPDAGAGPSPAPAVPRPGAAAPATRLPSRDGDTFDVVVLPPRSDGEGAQLLATYGGARVLEPFPTHGATDDAGQRWHRIIKVHEAIRNYIDGKAGAELPTGEELIAYGALLFRTLFPGDVGRLYDTARSLQAGRRLDVVFTSMIPWVADKPWEFAFDPARRSFLATEDIHFVRNVLTAVPAEVLPPRPAPLRILVVLAQPIGAGQLSVEEEVAVIRRGFEPLVEAGLARVDVLPRATPGTFHGWISTGTFDVVHFVGHGEFDAKDERGFLIFEDERGAVRRLNHRALREILCQRGIRLVFLNACETGRGGRADFNRGVAQQLVAGGLPAVVANQYKVLDASATAFAQHFYWSLAQGLPLGAAARESRVAVNYSISGEAIDWAVPVLYARDPNARLCESPAEPKPATPPQTTLRARRATREHTVRVAVWDVNQVFPRLEDTIGRLNRAQARFGFELVDLSAPLGTWQLRGKGAGGSIAFLHADGVAARLRHMPRELGVGYLACVTNLPMMGRDAHGNLIENIYGWWPAPGDSRVLLFSSANLDLPPHGPMTDRVVVNAMVGGLAGTLLETDSHKRGPKTCPLYFNPERSVDRLAGRQRFDKKCRARLAAAVPQELPALEQLLAAFHA